MKIKSGTIVFATQDCAEGRADARVWLREKGLTPNQVRLYSDGGMVLVSALLPLDIPASQ